MPNGRIQIILLLIKVLYIMRNDYGEDGRSCYRTILFYFSNIFNDVRKERAFA